MKLVISTNAQLLTYDGKRQRKVAKGYHWGVSWDAERLYVVLGKHVWSYGPNFYPLTRLFGPTKDPHGLLWHDGVLYLAHTGRNRLETWSGGRAQFINWTKWDRDVDHINCLWFHDGRFYVVEHQLSGQPKRVRLFDEGWNQVDAFEAVVTEEGIHNVYNDGSRLVTLAARHLVVWDVATKEYEELNPLAGVDLPKRMCYMRGLATDGDRYYVGVTRLKTSGDSRFNDAAVLVLDRDFQPVDVHLLTRVGAIKAVRLMDPLDLAHNGVPFPGGSA